MLLISFVVATSALAANPQCKEGKVIDLNLHPVIALNAGSEQAFAELEGSDVKLAPSYDNPAGFSLSNHTFTAEEFLKANGLSRSALEGGGFLRLTHGAILFSEFPPLGDCLLTYDAGPIEVHKAEQDLAKAKKKQALASTMVCDPDETGRHAIKAPGPAKDIKILIGQAEQGDGEFTITIYAKEGLKTLGNQTVGIANGKFASASSDAPSLFCDAQSFDDLCVKTEVAFALTGWKPFEVSTAVDWYEMSLNQCTVSR